MKVSASLTDLEDVCQALILNPSPKAIPSLLIINYQLLIICHIRAYVVDYSYWDARGVGYEVYG